MQLVVFTVLGAVIFLIAYTFGIGGTVSAMIFLTVLFIGAALRVMQPMIDWIRGTGSGSEA